MTITDDELLAIIDEVTIALGEILLSHRHLTESMIDDKRISTSQDRIEKRRGEIEKERDRIRKIRDAVRHRRDVEQIRKQHEKDHDQGKRPQTEEIRKETGLETITNQRGQVVGYRQNQGSQTVFLNCKGVLVAREVGGKTFDNRGSFVGAGRQGMRQLGQKSQG